MFAVNVRIIGGNQTDRREMRRGVDTINLVIVHKKSFTVRYIFIIENGKIKVNYKKKKGNKYVIIGKKCVLTSGGDYEKI